MSSLQTAWVACVRAAASAFSVPAYDRAAFEELAGTLSNRAQDPTTFGQFQSLFANVGVKLVYVESFPGGKLDGCAMLLEETPVIGISGRGKRLDKVLFTILHETAHVLLGHLDPDGQTIVDDLSQAPTGRERDADDLASALAISAPVPSANQRINSAWVNEQSAKLEVHPIVLIGRLQKDGLLSWKSTLVRGAPTVTTEMSTWIDGVNH